MADESVNAEWSDLVKRVAGVSPGPTGKEEPVSKGESATRGFLQGMTSNWGDEAAARIDQGISKIPGLRSVLPQDPRFPPLTDSGATYEQRRAAYRAANARAQEENPKTFVGGQVGGAIAQQVAMRRVPVANTLTSPLGAVTGGAAGGVMGSIAGAGASEGETPGQVAKDSLKGAAVGTVAGAVGGYLANKFPAGKTDLQRLGAKGAARAEIAVQRERIATATEAYPEIKAAFGKPDELLPLAGEAIGERSAANQAIMKTANDAAQAAGKEPGVPVAPLLDKVIALQGLAEKARGPGGVEAPAVKKMADSFFALANGKEYVPAEEVRKWLTDYAGPNTMPSADSSMEIAKREVGSVVKEGLHRFVGENAGADKLAELEKNNKIISGLSTIKEIATKAAGTALTAVAKHGTEGERVADAAPWAMDYLHVAGKGANVVANAGARPVIDKLAGTHRDSLEDIAKAAQAGDHEAVTKKLYDQVFGP